MKSEGHVKKQVRKVFDTYDVDKSGSIQPHELRALLQEIEPEAIPAEYEYALQECFPNGSTSLRFDEFMKWYFESTWFKQHSTAGWPCHGNKPELIEGLRCW